VQFVEAVTRILRYEGLISGDDDAITSFSQTQYAAAINLAKLAIQDELASLVADAFIPYEQGEATLTTVANQRTYALASDFVRFDDSHPFLLEVDVSGASENACLSEFEGGEQAIRKEILDYREQTSDSPTCWYWVPTTVPTIGLYPVPTAVVYYRYMYEKDVDVTNATDTLPFSSTAEANAFCEMASRRFKYLFTDKAVREKLFPAGLARDPAREGSRATLLALQRPKQPNPKYGSGQR
jgi:hypothetical protein